MLALLGCVAGGALAVGATRLLTRSAQVNFAQVPVGPLTFVVPALALLVVYLIVMGMCRGVRRVEVVGALVQGSMLDEKQTARRVRRQSRRARGTDLALASGDGLNRRLAWLDLRAEAGQWTLIPVVFALTAILIILPTNLLTTFQSPGFVTYLGAPQSDLRADLQFAEGLASAHRDVLTQMRDDDRLTNVRDFANLVYETEGEQGWEALRIEVGDYSEGTVQFVEGGAPKAGEIALSVLNAEQYGLSAGEKMRIRGGGGGSGGSDANSVAVSGNYQDVTSGGYTAKLQGEVTSKALGYVIYADTVEAAKPSVLAREYSQQHRLASVIPMQEYVAQTLAYVTTAFRSAAIIAGVFGLGVALLITCLFLKLRLTRERTKMGVLTAIGFSSKEIASQTRLKVLLTVVLGTGVGVVLAATVGESMVAALISMAGLGISSLRFIANPWLVYLIYPVSLVAAGYAGGVALTARLRVADKSAWLKG